MSPPAHEPDPACRLGLGAGCPLVEGGQERRHLRARQRELIPPRRQQGGQGTPERLDAVVRGSKAPGDGSVSVRGRAEDVAPERVRLGAGVRRRRWIGTRTRLLIEVQHGFTQPLNLRELELERRRLLEERFSPGRFVRVSAFVRDGRPQRDLQHLDDVAPDAMADDTENATEGVPGRAVGEGRYSASALPRPTG